MKRLNISSVVTAVISILFMFSCDRPEPEPVPPTPPVEEESVVTPEGYPVSEDSYVIGKKTEYSFKSTAMMMVGENIAVAASVEEGFTDVRTMMEESSEFFYAAVSPMLLDKEFDLKTEKALFTIISTLAEAQIETVAPEETSEIKSGKGKAVLKDGILTFKAELTLSDGTSLSVNISTEENEDDPIVINENLIGRGEEVKPLRAAFYKEDGDLTYLFFTPGNIQYFDELSIVTWYSYIVLPTALINGRTISTAEMTEGQTFMFGVVDNVNADNCFDIDNSNLSILKGTFNISKNEAGSYKALIEFVKDRETYYVAFDGECISSDVTAPEIEKEAEFTYGGEKSGIDAAFLEKEDGIWYLTLDVSNGKQAVISMSEKFWESGGTFGFSQDPNMSVTYDGNTYSKANGHSGTLTMHLDEEAGIVETEFTNYKDCEFYYKGAFTLKEYHVPFTLKVYDISSVSATVEVQPYDSDAPYYMDIINASDFEQAQKYGFDDYMTYLLETLGANTGKSREEVVEMISSYGNDGFIATTLKPETAYYAVAVGINGAGMTTTEVVYEAFTTLEQVESENVLEITASDVKATTAILDVSASNEDPYILAIEPANCIEGLAAEELADYIIQSNIAWGGLEQMTYTGSQQIEFEGKAGWEYAVVAFGYEGGSVTSDVRIHEFTMGEGGDPQACTFDFGYEFAEWEMYLDIDPSDETVVYICNIIKKSDLDVLTDVTGSTQSALHECLETLIEEMIVDCGSRERVIDLISVMGSQSFNIRFEHGTEYVQWAVPVDQSGTPIADFSVSEVFTTPEEAKSDASLTLKSWRVFDGTELAALYPGDFKGAKGYAVVELIVEPSETAAKWWSYIALDDLSDRSEETIIKNILMAPTQQGLTKQYIVAFWGKNTIMGVAQDADGVYGPLLLEVIDLNQDNALPGSQL